MFDFVIVGCGLSGATSARILAESNKKILIIDRRNHIAGNTYDFFNEYGILVHKYGPHIFHTNEREVWKFLSRFTKWREYQHKVQTFVNGKFVPMPINLETINAIYNTQFNSFELAKFLDSLAVKDIEINNSKDVIVNKIGEELYKLLFEGYTKKQWDLYPYELDKEVISRIPVRTNNDTRYFTDKYQGIPLNGYTNMIQNMLNHQNIKIMLNTDFKEINSEIQYNKLIFTGCIDEYFDYKYGNLPYRCLEFTTETYDCEQYQPVGVINYPNDYEYTRITEYKHFTGQISNKTTIMKEYSKSDGDPYYPIPQAKNKELYIKYKNEADKMNNIYFLGRLGTYNYMNMDKVVLESIKFSKNLTN